MLVPRPAAAAPQKASPGSPEINTAEGTFCPTSRRLRCSLDVTASWHHPGIFTMTQSHEIDNSTTKKLRVK